MEIFGNTITDNLGHGILNVGAATIGNSDASAGNVIARNGGDGVLLTTSTMTTGVRGNSIYDNGGLGINIIPDEIETDKMKPGEL